MKTKKLFIIAAILFAGVFSTTAKAESQNFASNLDLLIKSSVKYPAEAKEAGISGFVRVEVIINEDGTLTIKQANSNNESLKSNVISQLSQIRVPGNLKLENKSAIYEFKFRLL